MGSISDSLAKETFLGAIVGIPLLAGIIILLLPFILISVATGMPLEILVKNVLIFCIAIFLIWLFSKHQIIENGIVGLIVGILVYGHFKLHPVFCILIGAAVVGLLFFVCVNKIIFGVKTIVFSLIVTFLVYASIYSDQGLFPAADTIWKVFFFIIFLLENLFIRICTYDD